MLFLVSLLFVSINDPYFLFKFTIFCYSSLFTFYSIPACITACISMHEMYSVMQQNNSLGLLNALIECLHACMHGCIIRVYRSFSYLGHDAQQTFGRARHKIKGWTAWWMHVPAHSAHQMQAVCLQAFKHFRFSACYFKLFSYSLKLITRIVQ